MDNADKRQQKGPANKASKLSKSLQIDPLLPAVPQQLTDIQKALELGVQQHKAGNLPEAEYIYRQVLETDPNQLAPYHMLGVLAYQVGKFDESAERIAKVIETAPNLAEAHNNMGLVQYALGNNHFAIECYERVQVLKPDFPDTQKNIAQVLITLGQIESGLEKFQQVFLDNPQDASIANSIGLCLRTLGRHEEAIVSFQVAIDIQPNFSDAYNNLGNTLRDLDRLDLAINNYKMAFANDPKLSVALHNQGATLQEFAKYDEAANILKKSNHRLSYAKLLECLYTLGNQNDFYSELEVIVEKDDTNVGVAAISAFAANQFDCHDPYPYCKEPMDFISHRNVIPPTHAGTSFLNCLRKQILNLNLDGGNQSLLQFGFQSAPSLFMETKGPLQEIEKILRNEIDNYFSIRQYDASLYIKKHPTNYSLKSWYIIMEKKGELSWHHHPEGWLSGSFYIDMPITEGDEAAIKFALHGNALPIINQNRPTKIYNLNAGDLILFPSSLFHKTVPFHSDDTRLCIAFDLQPTN